jgi:hypothetical protein
MVHEFSKFYICGACIACALLLVGCAPPPPCELFKCWAGITPGTTTVRKAQTLLENTYGAKNVGGDQDAIAWDTKDKIDSSKGGLLLGDGYGKVESISVFYFLGDLTVDDLNQQIGLPSIVFVVLSDSPDTKCTGAILSYPDKGIEAELHSDSHFVGVKSTQSITTVTIMTPEKAASTLHYNTHLFDWDGYKDYCELMPDR